MLVRSTLWSMHRPRLVIGLWVLLCLGGGWSVSRLVVRLDTDVFSMLPQGLPAMTQLISAQEAFGSSDSLFVLATPHGEATGEDAVLVLESIAAGLDPTLVEEIQVRFPVARLTTDHLLPHLPLLLAPQKQIELARRLTPDAIDASLQTTRRRLSITMTSRERGLLALDPLGILPLLEIRPEAEGGLSVDPDNLGLRTADGTYVLRARPTHPPTDLAFDQVLTDAVERAIADAGLRSDVSVAFGGPFLTALYDYRLMVSDLNTNTLGSAIAVALLFVVWFRRFRALLIAFLPLTAGVLLTFLVIDLSGSRLTSATLGFGAMLIGLGIDLSIVYLGRYAYANPTAGPEGALADVAAGPLRGIAIGAVTTAGAFVALFASTFPALRQLGLITAFGILACLIAVMLVLPPLLPRFLPRARPVPRRGSSSLIRIGLAWPRATVGVAIAATLVLATGLPHLEVEDDLRALRSPDNPGVAFDETLARRLGRATESLSLLVRADTPAELDARLTTSLEAVDTLVAEGLVSSAASVRDLLPSLSVQSERLAHWSELRERGVLPSALDTTIAEALREEGFAAHAFGPYREALGRALSLQGPVLPDPTLAPGTPLELLVTRDADGRPLTQVMLQPQDGADVQALHLRFVELIGPGEDIVLTGFPLAARELRRAMWEDALRIVPVGVLLVVVLLGIDLRHPTRVLLALVPTTLGIVWMLGLMGLAGIRFHLFNLFVLALVQGIGVDYGVHLIHRLLDSGLEPAALNDLGAGILLAGLTTVAGFGSLGLSHYPALWSMGLLTTLGAAGSLLAALTVVPALWTLMSGGRRPSASDHPRPEARSA